MFFVTSLEHVFCNFRSLLFYHFSIYWKKIYFYSNFAEKIILDSNFTTHLFLKYCLLILSIYFQIYINESNVISLFIYPNHVIFFLSFPSNYLFYNFFFSDLLHRWTVLAIRKKKKTEMVQEKIKTLQVSVRMEIVIITLLSLPIIKVVAALSSIWKLLIVSIYHHRIFFHQVRHQKIIHILLLIKWIYHHNLSEKLSDHCFALYSKLKVLLLLLCIDAIKTVKMKMKMEMVMVRLTERVTVQRKSNTMHTDRDKHRINEEEEWHTKIQRNSRRFLLVLLWTLFYNYMMKFSFSVPHTDIYNSMNRKGNYKNWFRWNPENL